MELIKFIKLIKALFFFPASPSSSSQKITANSFEQMNLLKLIGQIQQSPAKSWHGTRLGSVGAHTSAMPDL